MPATLQQLQTEWNTLVPQAQARGIRVRTIRSLHETVAAGTRRVEWLRSQLGVQTAFTFGVEIEFILPRNLSLAAVATAIRAAGVEAQDEFYNHSNRSYWKVTTDASVPGGGEIVSPILSGHGGFDQLRKVMDAIREIGCTVNRSCGLHVHVGVANQSSTVLTRLGRFYRAHEADIESTLAPSRRGYANTYCAPVPVIEEASDLQRTAWGRSRYYKLNVQSFWRHGTVEFRQHQGTVEFGKAAAWVRFCLALVERAAAGTLEPQANGFDGLVALLPAEVAEHMRARRAHFAGRA